MQISLDGIGNIHDELRGSGTFESIEKNIKLLKEKNIIYFFKTTIHKNNYTKLEDIVLKAIELGGTSISFSFINPVGRGLINTDLHMTQKEIFLTFNELKLLKEKYERKIKVGIPILYRNSICPWIAYNYENKLKISPRIDVNGEVYLCSAFMNPKFSLGNIKKDSIKEILLSNKEISDLINFLKFCFICWFCILFKYFMNPK